MCNINFDLKWEVKCIFNVGVDFGMFGNWFFFFFNYYNFKIFDMFYLYNVSVLFFIYNIFLVNIGFMCNSGMEIVVGFIFLKIQDMELNVNVNVIFQ